MQSVKANSPEAIAMKTISVMQIILPFRSSFQIILLFIYLLVLHIIVKAVCFHLF